MTDRKDRTENTNTIRSRWDRIKDNVRGHSARARGESRAREHDSIENREDELLSSNRRGSWDRGE